jgi:hypothetical protein
MYAYQSNFPRIPVWVPAVALCTLSLVLGWTVEPLALDVFFKQTWPPALETYIGTWGLPTDKTRILISSACIGGSLLIFDQCLKLLSPGARLQSRILGQIIPLGLSAFFLMAGAGGFPAALGILCGALFVFAVLYLAQYPKVWYTALLFLPGFFAAILLPNLLWFFFPLVAGLLYILGKKKSGKSWLATLVVLAFSLWLHLDFYLLSLYSLDWSWAHYLNPTNWPGHPEWFKKMPQVLLILSPILHPGFCLLLPVLFALSKKTDWVLSSKRLLIGSLVIYLLGISGLPEIGADHLLPAYLLVLLLLFPAWDRFVSYGRFFFPRLALFLLSILALCQVVFMVYFLFVLKGF